MHIFINKHKIVHIIFHFANGMYFEYNPVLCCLAVNIPLQKVRGKLSNHMEKKMTTNKKIKEDNQNL